MRRIEETITVNKPQSTRQRDRIITIARYQLQGKTLSVFEHYYLTLVRDTFIIIIYHYICTRVIEYKED